ncbi:hypothetical protein LTR15_002645 [Elasticomyces elasticus]|nr:hypothetical protein LTR15_002645 [Elasticomyces elasticus]
MVFREKAKALFRRKNSGTDSSLSKTSNSSSNSSRERWPSNVYKPGEAMPRPKYRKPPTKEHKEKLEAFSFGDSWRRRSFQSNYSPMGTRAPSRRNSLFSRKSYSKSRPGSVSSLEPGEKVGVRQREMHSGAAVDGRLSPEVEAEGDDDVGNVGLSRVQSRDHHPMKSRPRTADMPPDGDYFSTITAHDHEPFSEHEITLALQRSHLAVPRS